MCWMGPMLPRMGEWAGHLHGHEGSFVGREKRSLSPTLRNLHAKSDRHRTMLERYFCPSRQSYFEVQSSTAASLQLSSSSLLNSILQAKVAIQARTGMIDASQLMRTSSVTELRLLCLCASTLTQQARVWRQHQSEVSYQRQHEYLYMPRIRRCAILDGCLCASCMPSSLGSDLNSSSDPRRNQASSTAKASAKP